MSSCDTLLRVGPRSRGPTDRTPKVGSRTSGPLHKAAVQPFEILAKADQIRLAPTLTKSHQHDCTCAPHFSTDLHILRSALPLDAVRSSPNVRYLPRPSPALFAATACTISLKEPPANSKFVDRQNGEGQPEDAAQAEHQEDSVCHLRCRRPRIHHPHAQESTLSHPGKSTEIHRRRAGGS